LKTLNKHPNYLSIQFNVSGSKRLDKFMQYLSTNFLMSASLLSLILFRMLNGFSKTKAHPVLPLHLKKDSALLKNVVIGSHPSDRPKTLP
jgi:hypothetical protein